MGDTRYQELLGLPASTSDQPTYYELLALSPSTLALDVIERAFKEKMTRLQQVRSTKYKGFIEYLKEELRHAKLTLSSEERRGEYDAAVRERRLAAVREVVEPVLALGQLPTEAMEALVSGVANKHGLSKQDARSLVEELLAEHEPAEDDEAPMSADDGGRTMVTRKLRGGAPERRALSDLRGVDLLRTLQQKGDAAFLRAWPCPFLIDDERKLLGKPPAELARARQQVDALSVFPVRRRDGHLTGEVLVGRGAVADVRLDVPSVSSRHAQLTRPTPTGPWLLQDLVSTNGTQLEGKRLSMGRDVALGPTAQVVFGAYRPLTFLEPQRLLAVLRAVLGAPAPAAPAASGSAAASASRATGPRPVAPAAPQASAGPRATGPRPMASPAGAAAAPSAGPRATGPRPVAPAAGPPQATPRPPGQRPMPAGGATPSPAPPVRRPGAPPPPAKPAPPPEKPSDSKRATRSAKRPKPPALIPISGAGGRAPTRRARP